MERAWSSRVARRRRRGATMIETAAAIVAMLILTLGLIQYGMLYNAVLSLNNLAREGARFAAVRVKEVNNKEQMQAQVCTYLQARAKGTSIEPAKLSPSEVSVDWSSTAAGQPTAGQPVRVVIRYDLKRNKGFVPDLLPLPDRFSSYQATAANLIE